MKKEARLLLGKSISSLTLSIEHFNRPWDCGRTDAVLIFLDHAFEMLLKAAILHRGGKIRRAKAKQTLGFDDCVRKAVTDGNLQFLSSEQALLLQAINSLRDAAQHYLVQVSEQHLYIHAQAGLTLFRDLLRDVFAMSLASQLPQRVLPLSTTAPTDLLTLFEEETREIQRLLAPGRRRRVEALARIRGLAIVEGAMKGEKLQPSDDELAQTAQEIKDGVSWNLIFPGVASINITAAGYGPGMDLRMTKNDGIAVHLVPEGTPGATTVAVKRVDELGFYNLGRDDLANKVGLSGPMTTAMIRYLDLQHDAECSKEFAIGKSKFRRYSQKAITRILDALGTCALEDVWRDHGSTRRQSA
jgi:hypothetical protein